MGSAEHKAKLENKMYIVNGNKFDSYFAAIAAAKEIGADVIQADNGARRWTPPAAVTAKKMRFHAEHKAAYAAQQRAK